MSKLVKSALYLTTALSAVAAMPVSASAQTAAGDDTGVQAIEQVVVTATRREERLQDVPISITVFNQQQLSNNNITTADQLATYTPSLTTDNRFGTENSTFTIRGFTQEIRTAPSVGVFFADVVAPRGGGSSVPAGDGAGPGMLFDLQNVQVLKGPQGTLFGRNTTGGDVLLVPVKPGSEFGGYVEGSYGNFDMKRIQGVINIPVNDTMRLRIGVDHEDRDGYLTNTSGVGPSRFGDVDYIALRGSFVWDITPDLENYTIASYMHSDNHGTVPRLYACDPTSQLEPATAVYESCMAQLNDGKPHGWWDVENFLPDAKNETRQWQVINTTTWQASDNLTVKNIASYAEFYQTDKSDTFGTNFTVADKTFVTDFTSIGGTSSAGLPFQTSIIYPAASKYTNAQRTITEELQLQGRGLGGKLIWQGGGYLELSDPLANVATLSPPLPIARCP
jgi:iron complex outermembrane receptor protein